MMLRWCDLMLRASAPLVPYDRRHDWLREWRAEFAYAAARASRSGRRLPASSLARASGAVVHAAWLRWDQWRVEMIIQDIKHALRSLWRKPSFTAVVVLTLAIGIGGTTAIFGAVNAVLLRPLPYPEPDQLVRVYQTTLTAPDRVGGTASPPDFTDWRRDSTSFTDLAAMLSGSYALTGLGNAEQVPAGIITGAFFEVMGVQPKLGRMMTTADEAMGSRDVVVLSHGLWARRFGSNPGIVGRQIVLDSVPYEVIGVMPEGFQYPLRSELWVMIRFSARDLETQRGAHSSIVGRLKQGVAIGRARRRATGQTGANFEHQSRNVCVGAPAA